MRLFARIRPVIAIEQKLGHVDYQVDASGNGSEISGGGGGSRVDTESTDAERHMAAMQKLGMHIVDDLEPDGGRVRKVRVDHTPRSHSAYRVHDAFAPGTTQKECYDQVGGWRFVLLHTVCREQRAINKMADCTPCVCWQDGLSNFSHEYVCALNRLPSL